MFPSFLLSKIKTHKCCVFLKTYLATSIKKLQLLYGMGSFCSKTFFMESFFWSKVKQSGLKNFTVTPLSPLCLILYCHDYLHFFKSCRKTKRYVEIYDFFWVRFFSTITNLLRPNREFKFSKQSIQKCFFVIWTPSQFCRFLPNICYS